MKKWMMISLLFLGIIAVSSLSYAWFSYVQRKSVVKLTSNEIQARLHLDDQEVETSLIFSGITYISFEKELMEQKISIGTNEVGLNYVLDIHVDSSSPAVKVSLSLDETYPEIITLLINEGFVSDNLDLTTDYHQYLQSIGSDTTSKEVFLENIETHNENVLNDLSEIVILPGETYRLQLIFWADYDALSDTTLYQERIYDLVLKMHLVSGKGDFND